MAYKKCETKLYLHIGMGKAGSTTIQALLSELGQRSNFVRPIMSAGFPVAWKLSALAKSDVAHHYWVAKQKKLESDQFNSLENILPAQIEKEVAATTVQRFVASSEYLSTHLTNERHIKNLISHLREIFSDIRVIIYVRDQRDAVKSFYAQTIKGPTRNTESYDHFIRSLDEIRYFWDYANLVKM